MIVFSSSETPETLSSKSDIASGLKSVHQAPPAAAMRYSPHHTQQVAKVIGVTRESPQPAVHDPAGVGRVGFETRQLPVADRLEQKAHSQTRGSDEHRANRADLPRPQQATWIGNETNHRITACSRNTVNRLIHQNRGPWWSRMAW